MADGNKDLVARLADLSEGAIQRLRRARRMTAPSRRSRGSATVSTSFTHARRRSSEAADEAREEIGLAGEAKGRSQASVRWCRSRREADLSSATTPAAAAVARSNPPTSVGVWNTGELEQHDDGQEPGSRGERVARGTAAASAPATSAQRSA